MGRHKVALCKSQNRCQNCKRKHHTSICTGTPQETPDQANKSTNDQSKAIPPVHATMTIPASSTPANINMVNTTCQLKTAIAPVRSPHFTTEANILFDEGAQRSFITQDLANQPQLNPTRKGKRKGNALHSASSRRQEFFHNTSKNRLRLQLPTVSQHSKFE